MTRTLEESVSETHKIYLASSWRNTLQPDLVKTLRDEGHQVYDFKNPSSGNNEGLSFMPDKGFSWDEVDPDWKRWSPERYRHLLYTHPRALEAFKADYEAMRWADVCVLLLPSGRSAHLEAGWFAGSDNKRLIIHIPTSEGFEPELMYLGATITCSEEELIDLLEADW